MAIVRVRTVFSGPAGSPWLGTAYFDGDEGDLFAQDMVDAVGAFWGAVDFYLDNTVQWTTEPEVLQLDEFTGQALDVFATDPSTGTGSSSGEIAPTLLQGLVRWRTGSFMDGREVRGRWFVPGLGEQYLNDGLLASGAVTAWNAAAAAYIATAGISPVIWQRPRVADPGAEPPVEAREGSMHPIVAGSATNRFSPLRTRRD
jgi:hypothetical protein